MSSAARIRGALACDSIFSRASVSASSASMSSTMRKCGDSAASSGKRRSSDWQKAWIVPMRMPPGRSSTRANSARALASVCSDGTTRSAFSSRASAASSSVTHMPRIFCSRTAISAAAALVKVRHWMRSGAAPPSIRRSRRSVSSLVLPDPADAPTKADTDGSEASSCSALARSRAPSPRPLPQGERHTPLPLPLREGRGGRGPVTGPLIRPHPRPPPTRPPGRAVRSPRIAARTRAAAATDSSGPARHMRRSANSAPHAHPPPPPRSPPRRA